MAVLATTNLPVMQHRFDHAEFDRLLREHVVQGMVDYDAFAQDAGFARYLEQLAHFEPAGQPRDEQLAF